MKFWLHIWRTRNSQEGFTLVETLVVATIFSIIGLGITTSFVSGIKLWDRAKNIDFAKCEFLLDMEKISRDFRQIVDIPVIGFEGDSVKVSFPALIGDSIVKITYKFDPERKTLLYKEVGLKDIISGEEEENYTEEKMLSLKELSLSYFCWDREKEIYDWKDSWVKDKGIFSAIKLEGKFKGEAFTKIIFIPIS